MTFVAVVGLATGVSAQTTGPAPRSGGLAGGLGGLLGGGGLPNIGSIGAGNAAGLLGYCLKNNLLGSGGALAGVTGGSAGAASAAAAPATGARGILDRLTGRPGVQTAPGYAVGQAGQVQAPGGQTLALGGLGSQLKTRMCALVLDRAKSFL